MMKKLGFVLAALMTATMIGGCTADTQTGEDTEQTGEQSEELSTTSLYGEWEATSGPIYRIELTKNYAETLGGGLKGRSFNATVDNGVRCITTPCDSSDEVGGVYKLSYGSRLTLASFDKPSKVFAQYLGDYRVTLSRGTLTLRKTDGTVTGTFKKAVGEKCGDVRCGAGLVCCNPLRNICTKPGMFCIQ